MARRGRCAPARSTAKSPTAFAANGAPRSTPISDPSSKPHGEDRSEPSTPSASPSRAAPCLAQLENVNGDLSNYLVPDGDNVSPRLTRDANGRSGRRQPQSSWTTRRCVARPAPLLFRRTVHLTSGPSARFLAPP